MLVIAFKRLHALTMGITLVIFLLTFISVPIAAMQGTQQVTPLLIFDNFAYFIIGLLAAAAFFITLLAYGYQRIHVERADEFYLLLITATLGSSVLAASSHFASFFLGLEILSISLYAMIGYTFHHQVSIEAAVKYLVLAASSAAFLLFGMALIYAQLGTMEFARIASGLSAGATGSIYALIGSVMMLVGFGFKLALVPFHLWTPDVYEGAPTSITALMAVGVKAAAFAAFARVFMHGLAGLATDWTQVLWVVAALTMTVGNVIAVLQQNIKRMLAYSSIAHAGYLLVGMVAGGDGGGGAILFYLLAYTLMNLGAFGVVMALGKRGEPNELLDDYAGVGFRQPFLGFTMTVFMLSLAGVPPLVGFAGKYFLFAAAVKAGYVGLVVIAVLNSVVSVYYYIGVIVKMYMNEGQVEVPVPTSRPYLFATMLLTAAGTVLLGVFPSSAFEIARQAFLSLG
jgi:NADH-quinone oxidoreductase subunit N